MSNTTKEEYEKYFSDNLKWNQKIDDGINNL